MTTIPKKIYKSKDNARYFATVPGKVFMECPKCGAVRDKAGLSPNCLCKEAVIMREGKSWKRRVLLFKMAPKRREEK